MYGPVQVNHEYVRPLCGGKDGTSLWLAKYNGEVLGVALLDATMKHRHWFELVDSSTHDELYISEYQVKLVKLGKRKLHDHVMTMRVNHRPHPESHQLYCKRFKASTYPCRMVMHTSRQLCRIPLHRRNMFEWSHSRIVVMKSSIIEWLMIARYWDLITDLTHAIASLSCELFRLDYVQYAI